MSQVSKDKKRKKRHIRVRKKVFGTPEKPRLHVYRSGKHMYAGLVDDYSGATLLTASTLSKEVKANAAKSTTCDAAVSVGSFLAQKAKGKKITKVVFDRSGYLYHGRVKALAEGARKGGLQF